jgi:hypothetical protein
VTQLRTNVSFQHPARFVSLTDDDRILAVDGAQWFIALLRHISSLEIDPDLCQEDWGVVVRVQRNRAKFWIGLSAWESDGSWLAHFHHGSFVQRFSPSGTRELKHLLAGVHQTLANDGAVSEIAWYEEAQMNSPEPKSFPVPLD